MRHWQIMRAMREKRPIHAAHEGRKLVGIVEKCVTRPDGVLVYQVRTRSGVIEVREEGITE